MPEEPSYELVENEQTGWYGGHQSPNYDNTQSDQVAGLSVKSVDVILT